MSKFNIVWILLAASNLLFSQITARKEGTSGWSSDNGDGTFTNPVLFADYSDPDVIRVGNDYYLVSSSFQETPGLPILHSTDLVNWTIIGHAIENLSDVFNSPQHGNGVWAPSIRFHNGEFYIYYGDPDEGIYMLKAKSPTGTWSNPVLVKKGKGLIDPCPLWDDGGKVYLVHAWAKSRAGFNSLLTVNEMNTEGTAVIDSGKFVYDGHKTNPTIEGPKFYKRNGFYYIFAPAGGVKPGWQTVLKSTLPYGPYDEKVVMDQGTTEINGPHQGAWIKDGEGNDWFIHFQDRYAYGRVVFLEPMKWIGDFPVIGNDPDGDGKGEPVIRYKKPFSSEKSEIVILQTSDDFSDSTLGLQWQWNANHNENWYSLKRNEGYLRLFSIVEKDSTHNYWNTPNIILQKFPAPMFSATIQCNVSSLHRNDTFGFGVLGYDYAFLTLTPSSAKQHYILSLDNRKDADKNGKNNVTEKEIILPSGTLTLHIDVAAGGLCTFGWSVDGKEFTSFNTLFTAREGRWIGARVGMFCTSSGISSGFADINWIRIQ